MNQLQRATESTSAIAAHLPCAPLTAHQLTPPTTTTTALQAAGQLPAYTRMPRTRPITGLKRRAPYYYVVHAWSRPFLETVGMIEAHFKGCVGTHWLGGM